MAEQLVSLTDRAVDHLKKLIQSNQAVGFRLSVKKAGCSGYRYYPEVVKQVNPSDVRVDMESGVTIFVDAACLNWVKGTTIDYVSMGLGQSQLQFSNPNAENECGCGESFNLKDK